MAESTIKKTSMTSGIGIVVDDTTVSINNNRLIGTDLDNFMELFLGYITNAVNSPNSDASGYLICIPRSLNGTITQAKQIWLSYNNETIHTRTYKNNNAWTSWTQI